mgnify:CR=1 FL=1
MRRFLLPALSSFAPVMFCAGCGIPKGPTLASGGSGIPPAQDAHLAVIADSTGSLWPLAVGGLLAIVSAIVAWFIGSRSTAAGLLAIGLVVTVSPVFLLDVLEHLSVPLAWILGIAAVASLAYYLGMLFQRFRFRNRLRDRASFIEDTAGFAQLTAGSVGRVLRSIDRPDFNARKDIR